MSRKRAGPPPGRSPEHLFGGKVWCACGAKTYARKSAQKYICPSCTAKIPAADLEAICHSQLTGFLFSDTDVSAYLDRTDATAAEQEALLAKRRDDLAKVKRDIDGCMSCISPEKSRRKASARG